MATKTTTRVFTNPRNKSCEAFTGHPDLRAGFESLAPAKFYAPGTILFRQGEPSRGVYLLLDGRANISFRSNDGRDVTFRNVGPGYVLGLPGTILNRSYLFTAEVIDDAHLAFVPADQVVEFLKQRGDLCFEIVQMLGTELVEVPKAIRKHVARHKRTNA